MFFKSRRDLLIARVTAAEVGYIIMALQDLGYDSDMIFAILHYSDIRKAICDTDEAQDAFMSFLSFRPEYAS